MWWKENLVKHQKSQNIMKLIVEFQKKSMMKSFAKMADGF